MLKQRAQEKKGKVEHPLAKYTAQGQLMCSLCNVMVKSDTLWPVHIKGKQHREVGVVFGLTEILKTISIQL